jgi:hypothetical protein
MSPVRYELGFFIQQDELLHSHRRENFKSYIVRRALCEQCHLLMHSLYPNPRSCEG